MRSAVMRLADRFADMPARLEAAVAAAVDACAAQAAGEARSIAPVDSGALRSGIGVRRTGHLAAAVVSTAPHAAMVEYGTSRTAPRPYMLPAARAVQRDFAEAARRAAGEVLK